MQVAGTCLNFHRLSICFWLLNTVIDEILFTGLGLIFKIVLGLVVVLGSNYLLILLFILSIAERKARSLLISDECFLWCVPTFFNF